MKKISVIIPAYNVEKYIRRCLDSLVNQTYENIEIIVVDDGSIDRTGDIVQEYVERYPKKVVLITKKNGGQAEARNLGLSKATGDYIGFVDSDDFVSTRMYELLYREAEEQGCDLVTCGYYGCDDVTGEITVYQTGYKGEFNQSIHENPLILRVNSPYPWNKLYTRELLERSGFQFRKGIIFEDLCAVFPLFMDAKKVGRVHEKLYYYIKNRKGGTISTFNEKHGQIIDALQIMNDAYRERGMFETFYDTLLFFNIRHIYARFDEMENYDNEAFCKAFTERANNLLDTYFPGWKESEEFTKLRAGEDVEENEEDVQSAEKIESDSAEKTSPRKKGKRRAEVFEELLTERKIQKNTVLIECYHGNDVRGTGYYIGKKLAEEGEFRVFVSAADEGKAERFAEMYNENWEFVDMTSEKYLEVLATAEYVINNRAFPGFYRKNKGQKFIFTDLLPSFMGQGKDVRYGTKNMQGIQFSLAQADAILYPKELQNTFVPLLEEYNMAEICCDKAEYISIREIFYNDRKDAGIKVAYIPAIKAFPGLKDTKHYLFLSELRRKLLELDERIRDDRKLCVCYPRIIRRRLQANDWKHIEFFDEQAEPYEVLVNCQGAIGEAGEELYVMKALGQSVARMSEDALDMAWSCGRGFSGDGFDYITDVEQMATWINGVSGDMPDKTNSPKKAEFSCGELLRGLKAKKNRKSGRKVVYIPAIELREEFQEFMQRQDVSKSIFFIEKENMNDNMAAWLREYGDELRYVVIIRSIVVRAGESRKIKYKLTTKDKLREKRDRERYL